MAAETARVVIVGAGLAGLLTGVALERRGVDGILVVDGAGAPGGVTRTIETGGGYVVEPAVGSMTLPHPRLSPLLGAAGVEVTPAVDGSYRHLLTRSGLVPVPSSPRLVWSPVIPWSAKLRALAEPLVRTPQVVDDETVATFTRRRFGHRAGAVLAAVMAAGVHAGDPERLSAVSAFPALVALERDRGSVLAGALRRRSPGGAPVTMLPVGGMAEVSRRLADRIGVAGGKVRCSSEVRELHRHHGGWVVEGETWTVRADQVVLAIGPRAAGSLLDAGLAEVLDRATTAPVAVVALGGPGDVLPGGFGYLALPGVTGGVVGCLFESSYAPQRAPDGHWLVKTIVGGRRHPEAVAGDDDAVAAATIGEVSRALGVDLEPDLVRVVRHSPGIPQYEVGHRSWLDALDRGVAERPGLHLTGWGYRGVGIAGLASDAVRVADRVAGHGRRWDR